MTTQGDGTQAGQGSDAAGQSGQAEAPPAWFEAFAKRYDERLERMSQKHQESIAELRKGKAKTERVVAPVQQDAEAAPQGEALSEVDVEALIRLGQVTANLTPERRKLALELKQRHGARATVDIMEALLKESPDASSAEQRASAPPGQSATSASNSALRMPETIEALLELKKSNPNRYREIVDHPEFDLDDLRRKRR